MSADHTARRRALVTGASAGIGATFAARLARDSYDLVVVARRRAQLDALAQQLQQDHGANVEVLVTDLTQPEALRMVEQHVADDEALEVLVNNAGFPGYRPFVELDPDQAEELIRLHVLALTRLTRAALPGMVARGHGAIINVASVLAFSASVPTAMSLPKRAVYAACKSYVTAFTELLHHELEGSGVRVQALCPGLVAQTEFFDAVPGFDRSRLATAGLNPEDVVTASLSGLRLGEVLCVPGLDDAALIERVRESERELAARAGRGRLAQRYTG